MIIFSRLRLRTKLTVLMALSALAVVASVAVSAAITRQRLIEDRIDTVRAVVATAIGEARALESGVEAGYFTRTQAQGLFRATIHTTRYDSRDDYLVVQDHDGRVVMHGVDPQREGQMTGAKDGAGRSIADLSRAILAKGDSGVMWYLAPHMGESLLRDKVAFVQDFKPWGLVFIASAWIDDVDAIYQQTLVRLSLIGGAILLVSLLIAYLINSDVSRSMSRLREAMTQIAAGNLGVPVPGIERGDEVGGMARAVLVFRQNAALVQQLTETQKYHAEHDGLTGLPNRMVLLSRLRQAVARAARSTTRGALLFIDLDRFKNVNDSLGHKAGDELLKQVAARFATRLRGVDTLSRHGGDEFVVLLEDIRSATDAADVAHSLIEIAAAPFTLEGGHEVRVGASIGVTVFPDEGTDPDALIQQADTALYEAKAAGKGTHRLFTSELTSAAARKLELEARLHRSLARREFVLHYQPLVSLHTGRIEGVEALVRWHDGERGLVPPGQFIPVAEESGFIVPLGEWVLRTACEQMVAWREAGVPIDVMAVNLSPKQFQQAGLDTLVADILEETGLPAHCLELEITEGVLAAKATEAEAKLRRLSDLGVRLAIDDFGTGYSSLSYLKRFPIDKLKIDQSFVRGIPSDKADMSIALAVIALAKSLELEVLAEGVETEAQRDFLTRHGCDTLQGYLFSKPLPKAGIEKMLIEAAQNLPPEGPSAERLLGASG